MTNFRIIIDFIKDKLLYPFLLLEKSNEHELQNSNYEYSKYFLGEQNFGDRYALMLAPLVAEVSGVENIESIYLVKSLVSNEQIKSKMEGWLACKNYALIHFYEVDDHNLKDEQLFSARSLRIYYVVRSDHRKPLIFLTEIRNQKLEVLSSYSPSITARFFRARQLVYNSENSFVGA